MRYITGFSFSAGDRQFSPPVNVSFNSNFIFTAKQSLDFPVLWGLFIYFLQFCVDFTASLQFFHTNSVKKKTLIMYYFLTNVTMPTYGQEFAVICDQ